jgi:hypothetical protein
MCLARLTGSERDEFFAGLADLVTTEPAEEDGSLMIRHGDRRARDQLPSNNLGALDRGRRSGQRGARDRRQEAMDSAVMALNSASFAKRWPEIVGSVKFSGTGR